MFTKISILKYEVINTYLSYKGKINNMQIYIIFHMEHLQEIIFLFVRSYYEPETSRMF